MAGAPYGPNPVEEARKHLAELAKRPPLPPEQCGGLIRDPAIERFGWIRENSDKYFRFRPRSVFYCVIACLVVPGTLYLGIKKMQRDKDIKAGRKPRDFL
ncbi:uncharacterized protein LOC110242460 [Exaiptasia diaphana]|uniref:NADH dehydrogenase [ubiquinone] 1 beta subcomplex subunit 4 n=1 Tax=Exaiptasia diaphana TaxID=2652724 RepID=A0A913XGM7_EXADI|nr:uncharacterized protein LOC110242460 [Exaiptasia diaphana]